MLHFKHSACNLATYSTQCMSSRWGIGFVYIKKRWKGEPAAGNADDKEETETTTDFLLLYSASASNVVILDTHITIIIILTWLELNTCL